MQFEYSLVARDIEREHVPVALEAGMGIMPWSPLAGGFLTGKYQRSDTSSIGRLSGPNPFGNSKFSEQNWAILEVLRKVSAQQGCNLSQVALNWIKNRPGVSSTLIGSSKVIQLVENLEALDICLSFEQLSMLETVSNRILGFTNTLASPQIRKWFMEVTMSKVGESERSFRKFVITGI